MRIALIVLSVLFALVSFVMPEKSVLNVWCMLMAIWLLMLSMRAQK